MGSFVVTKSLMIDPLAFSSWYSWDILAATWSGTLSLNFSIVEVARVLLEVVGLPVVTTRATGCKDTEHIFQNEFF